MIITKQQCDIYCVFCYIFAPYENADLYQHTTCDWSPEMDAHTKKQP